MSGSAYSSLEEWLPYMDTIPGKATDTFAPIAEANGCYITFRVAEVEPAVGMAYNAVALISPHGCIGKYGKTGINMADFMSFRGGNAGYPVFATEYGNLAMFIC